MNKQKIVYMILAVLLLTCCMAIAAADKAANIYTENKPNIVVTAAAPQFTIQLKSNPTTGYSWFLREYDSELLQPIQHHFQPADNKLIGAPGFERWLFRVRPTAFIVPHQTTLRFIYVRPWEKTENPTQQVFHVTTLGNG